MSKNEFLDVISAYLDELENVKANPGDWSEDAIRDVIHEEMLAVGVGPCFEDELGDMVDEAINRFDFDRPIESYLEDTDYVLRDDLDDLIEEAVEDFAGREGYATESMVQRAIDDSIDDLDIDYRVDNAVEDEIDRRDLVERSEVEDIVDDFLIDKGYEATIDTLIQEKDALLERLVTLEMDAVLGKLEAIVG